MTSQSTENANRGVKPQLSKEVNALNELLNSISPDKSICYTQFYQFYDTLKQLTEVKRYYKPDDSDNSMISQMPTKTTDFLWFLINPDKMESIRRKTIRDFVRIVSDNKNQQRKVIIDCVEDYMMRTCSDDKQEQVIRASFNYPGAKRSIVEFANIL